MAHPAKTHVVLVGEMGVGKTTVGRLLAQELHLPFLDSDEFIESETTWTGAQIAASEGVAALHSRELEVAISMVESDLPSVIALAASVVDAEEGRNLLSKCRVAWLVAPENVLAARRANNSHRRSASSAEMAHMTERRVGYYRELGFVEIDNVSVSPSELAQTIRKNLESGVTGQPVL